MLNLVVLRCSPWCVADAVILNARLNFLCILDQIQRKRQMGVFSSLIRRKRQQSELPGANKIKQ